ncbi:MAG: BatD family protein, partial [Muribaculaceae bacterium]|nr:BatD family protein [Muribaculaceae bacterium]
ISGNALTGTMTVEYTIVPQSVGEFKIPQQEFAYFDLAKKEYVTLTAPGYTLNVAKGSGTTMNADQRDIQAKNTDILHIKTGDKNQSLDHTPMVHLWWYWGIFACLLAIAITSLWIYRRQLKLDADVAGRRNSRANKVARKRLKLAESFMKSHQSEKFYEELLRAMWGYLSDKLNMSASQLTRQNIVDTLSQRGIPTSVSDKIIKILDDCEMARYTPDSSLDSSVEAIYNEATDTINDMEKSKITRK